MCHSLAGNNQVTETFHHPRSSQKSSRNHEETTSTNTYIDVYCKSKLLPLIETQKHITPFAVGKFLSERTDFVHNRTVTTMKILILYLCDNCLVPYKQNTMYCIADI